MMLPLQEILRKYNVSVKGVIHVGAHWAEEHDDYVAMGMSHFVYVEPCKEAFKIMVKKINPHMPEDWMEKERIWWHTDGQVKSCGFFRYACGSAHGRMAMHVSHNNQGQSNSLLEPSLHLSQHPEVVFSDAEAVEVMPLDDIVGNAEVYDMLAMDVQGYEGEVLRGATKTLKHIDIVYTEVNRGETYKGNALIEEIDELLSDFTRVETHWPSPNLTWGDAVYIRKSILNGIL